MRRFFLSCAVLSTVLIAGNCFAAKKGLSCEQAAACKRLGLDTKQIEKLVHSALEHEPSERKAFLRQVCGGDQDLQQEVESLLAHETDAKRILDQPALQVMAETLAIEAPTHVGKSLGPYQILRVLGAGGMGEVYRARDTRLDRVVAILEDVSDAAEEAIDIRLEKLVLV